MATFGILNGPNLNRLGKREPEVYGSATLEDLEALCRQTTDILQSEVAFFQSNHEGELIDQLHQWSDEELAGIVFNPGGLTHTSVALRDAISAIDVPVVEVHLSNVHAREAFRHTSLTAGACAATVAGMGFQGYIAALHYLASLRR